MIGTFDDAGDFHEKRPTDTFRQGWTSITSTWNGDILFYDSVSGYAEWGILGADGASQVNRLFQAFGRDGIKLSLLEITIFTSMILRLGTVLLVS